MQDLEEASGQVLREPPGTKRARADLSCEEAGAGRHRKDTGPRRTQPVGQGGARGEEK